MRTFLFSALFVVFALVAPAFAVTPFPTNTPLDGRTSALWLNSTYEADTLAVDMHLVYLQQQASSELSLYVVVELGGSFYFYPAFSEAASPLATFPLPAGPLDTGVFELVSLPLAGMPAPVPATWYSAFLTQQGELAEFGLASSRVLLYASPTPEPTNTNTPTTEPTATSTETPTSEPTSTGTSTPTIPPTQTGTTAPTSTVTNTETPSPVGTDSPTLVPSSTPTPTPSPSSSPTRTATQSATPPPTITETPTVTPTPSNTPTITPTPSHTPTPTTTPFFTPGAVYEADPIFGNMRFVPSGSFSAGIERFDQCHIDNNLVLTYTRSFIMMETELTRGMWADLNLIVPGLIPDPSLTSGGTSAQHPAQNMTWFEALLFANEASKAMGFRPAYYKDVNFSVVLDATNYAAFPIKFDWDADGYRLPVKFEWEHAAKANTGALFSIPIEPYDGTNCESCEPGDFPLLEAQAWFCANAGGWSHPIGQKAASLWGFKDIHGNVAEFCFDSIDLGARDGDVDHIARIANNSACMGGDYRMVASLATTTQRSGLGYGNKAPVFGLRLVRTVTGPPPTASPTPTP